MAFTAADYQSGYGQGKPTTAIAAALSDTVDLATVATALFVTGAGNLKVTLVGMADGTSVTFSSTASQYHNIIVKRVWSTGTTATGILALS